MNKSYIELLNDEYLQLNLKEREREILIQENNVESRDVRGYHGREILELLQNADDAYKKKLETSIIKKNEIVTVLIEYKDNILTISNTGTTFDREGIKSVVQGNNSPKGSTLIGNKGTGFRSVLNWANKVQIFSGDFNIEFSKEFAAFEFDKIKDKPQIIKQIKKKRNLHIPMLSMGKEIDPIPKSYDTVIRLYVDPNTQKDDFNIEKQINNIDENLLLFLSCLDEIDIKTENLNILYKRTISYKNKIKIIRLEKIINCSSVDENILENSISDFYVFNKKIDSFIKESTNDQNCKDVELAIAIPMDNVETKEYQIYTYFPIQSFKSPFNCVMHATFLLDDQRNNIISSDENKKIFAKLLEFLIDISRKFRSRKNKFFTLYMLTPHLMSTFSYYGPQQKLFEFSDKLKFLNDCLKDFYKSLESEKIFPNILGKHLSFSDEIKTISFSMPKEFKRAEFDKLLAPIERESSTYLLERIAAGLYYTLSYSENELNDIVNSFSDSLDIIEQINLFIFWNKNFKNTLPNLIKTQSGQYLNKGEEYFFLVGDVSAGLPSWVRVPALSKLYQDALLKIAEKDDNVIRIKQSDSSHITRIISQNKIYPLINFNYRDKSSIISAVNNSVDTYNKSLDFIKWLWSNYKSEDDQWQPPIGSDGPGSAYKFPTSSEEFANSKKIYWGRLNGYPLNNYLFNENYKEFMSLDKVGFNSFERNKLVQFFTKFGVLLYPKIEVVNIRNNLNAEYKKFITDEILKGKIFDIGKSKNIVYLKWNIPYIDGLEEILTKQSFANVIRWILSDIQLQNELRINNYYNRNEIHIECKGNLQTSFRRFNNCPNYLLFMFNNLKWIDIRGKKYSPNEVLDGINNRQNSKFDELLPVISRDIISENLAGCDVETEDALNILELFDFKENPTELSSQAFYGLMLELPNIEINKSIELSGIIYRKIESHDFNKDFGESTNKTKFFKEGKVLVKYMNTSMYVFIEEAFCPTADIVDKKGTYIVDKGQRTNNVNFAKILGCQIYKSKYSIESIKLSEAYNDKFREDFKNFLYYAKSYSERNANIKKQVDKLEVFVVSSILVKENNQCNSVFEDYALLKSDNSWYIVLNGNYNDNKISECLENVFSNIANTPGFNSSSIGELFRQKNKNDREFLIQKEFGSLEVLYRLNDNPIKENFIQTILKLSSAFDESKIEGINFSSINNIINFEKIRNILIELNIDIKEFKEAGFLYEINAENYNAHLTEKFIKENLDIYKNWIYNKAIQNSSLQNSFLKLFKEFEEYTLKENINSVYFDASEHCKKVFDNFTSDLTINCKNEYDKNYEVLNPEKLFEDEIENNIEVQTFIYFNQKEKFDKWIQLKRSKNIESEKQTDIYQRFDDVVPMDVADEFKEVTIIKETKGKRRGGSVTESDLNTRNKNQKTMGNIAEKLVYNLLIEKFGKNNVRPKSEAFVKLRILKPGQASSGDYDLSYFDENKLEIFVEVKSSSDRETFFITPNELKFAQENPD